MLMRWSGACFTVAALLACSSAHAQYYAPPPPPQPVGPPRVVYNWDADIPPPDGYTLDWDINARALAGGIGLLSGAYLTSILAAAVASKSSTNPDAWAPLYAPVAGPFIALGTVDPSSGGFGLLIGDGVMQLGGALAIAIAFIDVRHKLIRQAGIQVTPIVSADTRGFALEGSF